MTFPNGYDFMKVKTSHGPGVYVSQYGEFIKVVPCGPNVKISKRYTNDLIRQIESKI